MGVALGEHAAPCRCGHKSKSSSSSLRGFRTTKQNKSMRSNEDQKLSCHFEVTSELPARLDPQSLLLHF